MKSAPPNDPGAVTPPPLSDDLFIYPQKASRASSRRATNTSATSGPYNWL
jgi:hypothetical protein